MIKLKSFELYHDILLLYYYQLSYIMSKTFRAKHPSDFCTQSDYITCIILDFFNEVSISISIKHEYLIFLVYKHFWKLFYADFYVNF